MLVQFLPACVAFEGAFICRAILEAPDGVDLPIGFATVF